MFRFLLLATILAMAFVCIETTWVPDRQELTLRMRRPDELSQVASEGARGFGGWLVRWWTDAQEAEDRRPAEELTWKERQELDQLVKDATRDPENEPKN
jgi:hypothetical protein